MEEEEFVMDDQDFLIKLKDEHKFCKGFSSKIELKYNEGWLNNMATFHEFN